MAQIKKSWKFLLVLAILGGLYGAHPYMVARVVAGDDWQGVVPELTSDNLYYMTRAEKAIHGEVMGNHYYATLYKAPSPSFSIADSITGIPHAFLSPFWAAVWNAFLWNAVFAFLLGVLLLQLGFSRGMIVVSLFFVSSYIFWHMNRVTNMQTIFPFSLLFLILFLWTWYHGRSQAAGTHDLNFPIEGSRKLEVPRGDLNFPTQGSWKSKAADVLFTKWEVPLTISWDAPLLLGLFAGFTIYLQSFLFQVIAASLAVGVVLSFILRRMQLARSLIISIATMVILSIPYFLYFHGISDFPVFAETINWFGGVRSHFPSPVVFNSGRWLILLFVWSFLLWLACRRTIGQRRIFSEGSSVGPSLEDVVLTVAIISLGTLGVMVQNIITGVDVAGPSHTSYYIQILLPIGLVLLTFPTIRVLRERGIYVQRILLPLFALLLLLVLYKVFVAIPTKFPSAVVYRPDSASPQYLNDAGNPQYIMPALIALSSLPGTHVIAAPEPLSGYIPLYTGQHVLFSYYGRIFSVSTTENTERWLTTKLGQSLTKEEVTQAYEEFGVGGVPSEVFERNMLARKFCTIVLHSSSCATLIVARVWSDDGTIDQSLWFDYYEKTVRPNVVKYLRRFDVSQVVIDRRFPVPEFLRGQTPWYEDEYYGIYNVTPLYFSSN